MNEEAAREAERLDALRRYHILDTPPDPTFEHITQLAADIFKVPMACVTLVDENRMWLKSTYGADLSELPREAGLCTSTIMQRGVHHLRDTLDDPVARENSIVKNGVRFYAGAPLTSSDGFNIGTLCVLGIEPRELTEAEASTLLSLARFAMSEIERHRATVDLSAAQKALQASQAHYQTLAELAPVGIFRASVDGHNTYVNRRWTQMTGISAAAALGRGWMKAIHPDDRHLADEWYSGTTSGEPFESEFRFMRPDGSVARVLGRVEPERDAEGHVTGFVGTVTDVTLQRQMDDRMQQAQRLESLGMLAGGVAHDFNNILVGILGNASLALSMLNETSELRPIIKQIEGAGGHASELVNELLAYSGKAQVERVALKPRALVEETAQLLDAVISKRARLEYRFSDELPLIEGDAIQLRQVIMNLITNASDAIEGERGVIIISLEPCVIGEEDAAWKRDGRPLPGGAYVCMDVVDDGCGMDSATLERIFDPFYTTKAHGRGLGLAAVSGIVNGHGGAIRVTSEPGQGTRFSVTLPATAVQVPNPVQTSEPELRAAEGEIILVIDDEPLVSGVASTILERAGYGVLKADSGGEALRVFEEHSADIAGVLLDMTMPDMSGDEVLVELHRLRPGVPVVLTSGHDHIEVRRRFVNAGDARFLKKPYRHAELVREIQEAVAARA